tara:strand:+ start:1794 stop:2684 length:891 start_codon:yes stop_codon:yes gene_type:complete
LLSYKNTPTKEYVVVFKKLIKELGLNISEEQISEIMGHLQQRYPDGEDPWGLNLKQAESTLKVVWPLYKHYFKTRIFGQENVADEPYIIISNHSGQIAIDGMLISTAFASEIKPPRILRSMVDRFFTALPWIATAAAGGGAVLGDRQNGHNLLTRGQSILAFPEGVTGVAKSTKDYYELQKFTHGFLRMALSTRTKILPLAVVGCEEIFPWVYQAKSLSKFLGTPALPISPLYLPLPSPVDIHIGQPIELPEGLSADAPDREIEVYVQQVKKEIQYLIEQGLQKRRPFFANQKGNI